MCAWVRYNLDIKKPDCESGIEAFGNQTERAQSSYNEDVRDAITLYKSLELS